LPRLANALLNRYLSLTGDYAGMALLPLYWVYRAMVRAKVGLLQPGKETEARHHLEHLLALCQRYVRPETPGLLLTHGLSGSGKSWLATRVAAAFQALHLRSDVERKRIHSVARGQDTQANPGEGLYGPGASERTYAHLLSLCSALLDQGFSVVVDAAFLTAAQRAPFTALAQNKGVPMVLLVLDLPETELRRRIAMRRGRNENLSPENRDPSDADERVLEFQMRVREIPTVEEAPMVLDERWPLNANAWLERMAGALNRTIVPE
jgi:predicted kinase